MNDVRKSREKVLLEKRIMKFNDIRDSLDESNKLYYPWILRFIAGIYSKYYTKKWERWND